MKKHMFLVLFVIASALLLSSCAKAAEEGSEGIDIDLTKMSGTMVYSKVYDMITNPASYEGKIVRMKGRFSYMANSDRSKYYTTVIIQDATACCQQGFEFVWTGHDFPGKDYPSRGTEVTVTGVFEIYSEGSYLYPHLVSDNIEVGEAGAAGFFLQT